MAGLADVIAAGVATAKAVVGDLLATVTHYAYSGATADGYGKLTWGAGTPRQALVEWSTQKTQSDQGPVRRVVAKLTFLEPVSVDTRDRFVIPDPATGSTVEAGPVVSSKALVNPATGKGYVTEVTFGGSAGGWEA